MNIPEILPCPFCGTTPPAEWMDAAAREVMDYFIPSLESFEPGEGGDQHFIKAIIAKHYSAPAGDKT